MVHPKQLWAITKKDWPWPDTSGVVWAEATLVSWPNLLLHDLVGVVLVGFHPRDLHVSWLPLGVFPGCEIVTWLG